MLISLHVNGRQLFPVGTPDTEEFTSDIALQGKVKLEHNQVLVKGVNSIDERACQKK